MDPFRRRLCSHHRPLHFPIFCEHRNKIKNQKWHVSNHDEAVIVVTIDNLKTSENTDRR